MAVGNSEFEALVNLIKALIKTNKRVVTLTNIMGIQKKLMRQYPSIILNFKVNRDFEVACKMKGSQKDLSTLGMFLEEYLKTLMEILPPKNLADRIFSTVQDLGQEAALELLASSASEFLPVELVEQISKAADFGDRLDEIRGQEQKIQALSIYEEIYSVFLKDIVRNLDPKDVQFISFCNSLEVIVKGHYTFIDEFKIADDCQVSLKVGNADMEELLGSLAHIYDSLVYGASQVWNEEEVQNLGRRTALTVLGEFEEIPDSCGVTASLLKGALSSKVRSGSLGLDSLLGGGFERNSNTLLISPNLIERDFLLSRFIRRGFQSGEGTFVIVSNMDTDRLLDMLADTTHEREGSIPLGKLVLHTFWPEKDDRPLINDDESKLNEDDGPMTENPRNLIDLHRFLVKSMRNFGPGPKRALIEILDSAYKAFGEDRLYWYLSRYVSILKQNGFSTVFLASMETFGKKLIENIMDLFECTLQIRRRSSSFSYEIGKVALKKAIIEPKFKLITFGDTGLNIIDNQGQ